ncbi:MAG TPA: DUF4349 domain-containing protein [Terriglobales bacterium]|jgi:anti-sigma factor RsiW|nr:DUF4349 domain-containing protein [Terriglobales bacterium]
MNTSTHPVAPEEVMAFLDNELSVTDAQAVSSHLEDCAECKSLAEEFRRTSQSLASWNIPGVPARLENLLMNRVAEIDSGFKGGKRGVFTRANSWSWKRWAIASGTTVAALLMVMAISVPNLLRSHLTRDEMEQFSQRQGYDRDSRGIEADGPPIANSRSIAVATALVPMIARTVSVSIVVKDLATSRSSLDIILARHHGYSAQLTVSTPQNAPQSLQASLRIPVSELPSAVADLKTLGRVENESQSGEEVTQQHTDLVARLKNARDTEQQLRTILQERTGKVAEVLQVEEEIARVRGDIESMEAEQKTLEHRVDFGTVELQITEEYKAQLYPPSASVSTRILNALVVGYRNGSETLLGLFVFVAEYGPTLLICLVIFALPVIFVWRRYRRMMNSL